MVLRWLSLFLMFSCTGAEEETTEVPLEEEALAVVEGLVPKSLGQSLPDPRQGLPEQPNIVLVVIDTLRADHLGLYGHARDTTPNIDRLGREGLWFSRAYAHSGWTLPSFASLFSGLLPHQHKVGRDRDNHSLFGRLDAEVETLAELLQHTGYRTGAVMNNTFLAPEFGLHQGFDDYNWQGASNKDHRTAQETVDLGLQWLAEAPSGQPSFLVLHFMEPHANYAPRPEVRHRFTPTGEPPIPVPFSYEDGEREEPYTGAEKDYLLRLYDEEIYDADLAIGRLTAGLETAERTADTVLVVTADHGEEFWDHGRFEHGKNLFGELTRVPLVMSGPGMMGGEIDLVVEHLDLFETLLELGGQESPVPAGESIWTLLTQLSQESYLPMLAQRTAVSDNTLYGVPRVSIVDFGARYMVDQARREHELWAVDERGLEGSQISEEQMMVKGQALHGRLVARRGDLEPIAVDAEEGSMMDNRETFDQLRALGYLEP